MTTLEFARKNLKRLERDQRLVAKLRECRGPDARKAELEQHAIVEGSKPTWADEVLRLGKVGNGAGTFLAQLDASLKNDIELVERVIATEERFERRRVSR